MMSINYTLFNIMDGKKSFHIFNIKALKRMFQRGNVVKNVSKVYKFSLINDEFIGYFILLHVPK